MMFEIFPLLVFTVMCWCLGYSITSFVNIKPSNLLERFFMNIGFGLGVFPLLNIVLSLIRVPLDWRIILGLSLIMPIFHIVRHFIRKNADASKAIASNPTLSASTHDASTSWLDSLFKIQKDSLYILVVILLFLATLYVMNSGAFSYPWLEDGDSWGHMGYAKYIELEKTIYNPNGMFVSHYSIPYPPGYDVLMGILFQVSSSVYWAQKFFNALLISLAIVFFYFFVRKFTGSTKAALFSAFILTVIPSFLSHFIWSTVLGVILFFPAFYCIFYSEEDRRWIIPAILVSSGILLTVPVTALYFGAFLGMYWLGKVIVSRSIRWDVIIIGAGTLLVSLIFWAQMFIIYSVTQVFQQLRLFRSGQISFKKIFTLYGTGSGKTASDIINNQLYTVKDFIWVTKENMINNPQGIGLFISILVIIAFIYLIYRMIKERKGFFVQENSWLVVSLLLLVLGIFSVLGAYFPVRLPYPFRAWVYLAIPVAILSYVGYSKLVEWGRYVKIPAIVIFVIVVSGVLLTSGYQKYTVNTAMWGDENFMMLQSQIGISASDLVKPYQWMQSNLPKNTKVMSFCGDWLDVLAYDKLQEGWVNETRAFNINIVDKPIGEAHSLLKSNGYDYMIFDLNCAKPPQFNKTYLDTRFNEIVNSSLFTVEKQFDVAFLFKVI